MDKAIIVDHLTYKDVLNDVSFTIQKGEFVGVISTEDANKNLLLNIISGLIKPTTGFISVLGYDPDLKSPDFLKQLSVLLEPRNDLTKDLSPIEMLEITKSIYGLSNREFNRNLSELTQYIQEPNLLNGLIYKPKIVLLKDQHQMSDSLYEYNQRVESTVLFFTNKFDDLMNLVRRVIILDTGKVLFDGAIDEIIIRFATEKIIKAKLSSKIDQKLINEIGILKKYVYPYVYVSVPGTIASFAAAELMQNFPITSLTIEELSVEEIIENMKK